MSAADYGRRMEADHERRRADHDEPSFSGRVAAELVRVTYRQIDYWARTDLVRPSLTDADGSGSRRAYSRSDLVRLNLIAHLLAGGVKLERVRQLLGAAGGDRLDSGYLLIGGHRGVRGVDPANIIDDLHTFVGLVVTAVMLDELADELRQRIEAYRPWYDRPRSTHQPESSSPCPTLPSPMTIAPST